MRRTSRVARMWRVYLAVWNLVLSGLTEAHGSESRQVEAGGRRQQRRCEKPPQHRLADSASDNAS